MALIAMQTGHPVAQLLFRVAVELVEIPPRAQESILRQIRRVAFGLQVRREAFCELLRQAIGAQAFRELGPRLCGVNRRENRRTKPDLVAKEHFHGGTAFESLKRGHEKRASNGARDRPGFCYTRPPGKCRGPDKTWQGRAWVREL